MNRNVLIVIAILAIGAAPLAFGHSQQAPNTAPVASGHQASPSGSMEQRSLFRKCVDSAEHARRHLEEVGGILRHRPETDKVRPHLTEVRGAVTDMLEDHHRFVLNLNEEQRTAVENPTTTLEQLGATINAQLEGLEQGLSMPKPDAKVLARYVKKTDRLLREWQEQHRKMSALLGMKDL